MWLNKLPLALLGTPAGAEPVQWTGSEVPQLQVTLTVAK